MDNISKENIDLKIKLLQDFMEIETSLNGESKSSFHKIRQDAIVTFEKLGFPVKKLEEWKYTNINPILKHEFKTTVPFSVTNISKEDIKEFLVEEKNTNILVFVNGQFSNILSHIVTKNDNVYIGNFIEGRVKFGEVIDKHFSKYADYRNQSLTALNTAFAKDGAFIFAGKGEEVKEPVHILYISDSREDSYLCQPRNLFVAEENANLKIAEEYYSIGEKHSFTNVVTEIYCGANSNLERYKIQNEGDNAYNINTANVMQEKDSRFSDTTVSWGGAITRNNLCALFNGTNTECHFYGLYLLNGKQHVDNHTLADHAMPNCYSNELYKGIIDDKATGVFNGKIMVREDAQKTNAYQSNGNILLSADATVYSKPQLEIFADDVKCSHGATTGQLNEDEMFYLQARGIGKEEARVLLLNAFAGDVIDSVKIDSLREKLERTLSEKLARK
ncbi:MAG TPA: Fe-S cluster assembly protein SufD [Ignavibacteria bacterium]|nr:Fe-S cluster assembly protein SufD [Ignavibacteria bacterium]